MPWPDRLALAALLSLLVAFGLFRIDPIDVPVHLAIGRLIWESGAPLTTNTLSWTFPDFPMHQQYPLYQVGSWLLLRTFGWESLSLLCCVTWTGAALAWGAWAGGARRCAELPGLWLFALVGVQRHLVPRPEVFTLGGLALLLVAWERWRKDRAVGALVAMVLVQWVMVNTHQMFVLGMALQAGFVAHLLVTRALAGRGWVDDADARLPVRPLALTLLASAAALAVSPNGLRIYLAPLALLTTVGDLGAAGDLGHQSAELAPVWTDPLALLAAVGVTALAGVAAARARGRWQVYELGVLAMGLVLVLAALRGIPFYALAAAAVATRWAGRAPPLFPASSPVHPTRKLAVALVAVVLLVEQVRPREHAYLLRQQGLGRAVGSWGEHVTRFLREHPPPGEMLNIGWTAANYLVFDVYPVRRVFVDGRWEAYPKPFLADCMAMVHDAERLRALVAQWDPGFLLAEMRMPAQQERLAELVRAGEAELVYVDSIAAVAVRPGPASEAYLARFALAPAEIDPPDWLPEHPILHAQQQVRVARLLRLLGEDARAEALLAEARRHADHPAVRRDLETVDPAAGPGTGPVRGIPGE